MLKETRLTSEGEKAPYRGALELPPENKSRTPKNSFTSPVREIQPDEGPNFFDLLRIKNLGGELNKAPANPKAARIPLPSFVMKDKKGADSPSKPGSKDKSPLKGDSLPKEAAGKNGRAPESAGADKARDASGTKKEGDDFSPNSKAPKASLSGTRGASESGFILSIKWVVKLLFSLVFLVWIFILGVLVGRASMQQNSNFISKSLNPPSKVEESPGAFSAGPGYALEGVEEPGVLEYPYQDSYQGAYQDDGTYGDKPDSKDGFAPEIIAPSPPPEPKNYSPSYLDPKPQRVFPENSYAGDAEANAGKQSDSFGQTPKDSETKVIYQSQDNSQGPLYSSYGSSNAEEDPGYWPEPPTGNGSYTVQVGSPASEKEAKRLVEKYREKGFDAYYYSNGSRYPTRVGRFDTRDDAETARSRLEKEGAVGPYVSKLNL
jgi:cell division septation protein DedD